MDSGPSSGSGVRTAVFELHNTSNNMLTVGPRLRTPITDDLVLAMQHPTYGDSSRRSVLLSRPQVRELLDWLTTWYEHGWHGVRRAERPTSADIIEHYRDIAVRERLRADHERIDAHRLLHAAVALHPTRLPQPGPRRHRAPTRPRQGTPATTNRPA
jgi:hypothetical protein